MKFTFEHLGSIDNATLELAPLTVICGLNNTGKTYVAYAIYALFAVWRELVAWRVPNEAMQNLQKNGVLKLDLQQNFVSQWDKIRQETAHNWKKFLPNALSAPEQRFENTILSFELSLTNTWIELYYKSKVTSDEGKVIFTTTKPAGSSEIEIVALRSPETPIWPQYSLEEFVRQAILNVVLESYMHNVFMASAERTGAVIFKEELNLTKNKIVSLLAQLDKDKSQHINPTALLNAVYQRGYALPIDYNVRFVNQLQSLEGKRSKLISEHSELLDDFTTIVGGTYAANKEGNIYFIPHRTKTQLALTEASSSARSLLILWYWLTSIAAPGDMLMIDEPELNLHPVNQRKMARFLAKLVNMGVNVFVTTHSDYIVKEFNTLIMLAQRTTHTKNLQQTYHYKNEELLDPQYVNLYMTSVERQHTQVKGKRSIKINTLKSAMIYPDRGIEVTTFDTSIEEMNNIQSDILYGGEL